jgi:hypothetical protein
MSQKPVARLNLFAWKQFVTSWDQSSRSLQRAAFESKAVEHLQFLLVLQRLLARKFLGRVSFVHIVFREDSEIPPVSAALLRLHLLDNAGVESWVAHA